MIFRSARIRPVVLILCACALFLLAAQVAADGLEPGEGLGEPTTLDQVKSGTLLLKTGRPGLFLPAPSLETDVDMRVTGLVNRAVVRQRFENPTEDWVEGIYAFPLPENAAVDAMRLVIGERVVEGEIQEREQAKKTYTEAKAQGKKAALVEQERPNLFTTSVANLGPGEVLDVVIEYQQEIRYDQGRFKLRFPMTVGPRYIPPGSSAALGEDGLTDLPFTFDGHGWATPTAAVPDADRITPHAVCTDGRTLNPVNLALTLDAGLPIHAVESSSHDLHLEKLGPGAVRVTPKDGVVPADRDFVLEWGPPPGEEPHAALFQESTEDAEYYLLMLLPPHGDTAQQARLERETLFVIDTSGSMDGTSIQQARSALNFALERLQPGDYFNIIRFSSHAERLFPESVPADSSHLNHATRWVTNLQADGGTEILEALETSLQSPKAPVGLSQVIFITDGSVGNEDQLFAYIDGNLGSRRLFTVGIGSAPNSHFMRRAAEVGRGTFTHIGASQEVARRMADLFRKLDSPVLHDLDVQWDVPGAELYPDLIGDLYLGEPVQVAVRTQVGGEGVTVRGFRGHDPWQTRFDAKGGATHNGLAKLWARRKIEDLTRRGQDGRLDGESVRVGITALALEHHLVSKHTSLVAIDKTPTRPEDEITQSRPVPVQLPAGWTKSNAQLVMPQGGTASRLALLLGSLALLFAYVLLRGGRS